MDLAWIPCTGTTAWRRNTTVNGTMLPPGANPGYCTPGVYDMYDNMECMAASRVIKSAVHAMHQAFLTTLTVQRSFYSSHVGSCPCRVPFPDRAIKATHTHRPYPYEHRTPTMTKPVHLSPQKASTFLRQLRIAQPSQLLMARVLHICGAPIGGVPYIAIQHPPPPPPPPLRHPLGKAISSVASPSWSRLVPSHLRSPSTAFIPPLLLPCPPT